MAFKYGTPFVSVSRYFNAERKSWVATKVICRDHTQ